ncbi:MAG: hypothetical protein ACRC3B_08435 [Bacteroidia bacterium]
MVMRLISFILFLFSAQLTFAQSDSLQRCRLLLVFDTPGKVPYLSYIEESLKVLVYSGGNQEQIFCKVSNLNAMRDNLETEADLSLFLNFINPKLDLYTQNSKSRQERDSTTVKLLTGFGQLMKVTVTSEFGALLYSFQLYNVLSSPGEIPVLDPYSNSEQLINPKDELAPKQLMLCIKNVCKVSNAPPQVRISPINAVKNFNYYSVSVNDTLKVIPYIIDPDSPEENFSYTWFCIPQRKSPKLTYNSSTRLFSIVPKDTGHYIIWVIVTDQINKSNSDTLKVAFVFKPKITNVNSPGNLLNPNPTELQCIYQSYCISQTKKPLIIRPGYHRVYLEKKSDSIRFQIDAPWIKNKDDIAELNRSFHIIKINEFYAILHDDQINKAGRYHYLISAMDRGIQSEFVPIKYKYYKAWPLSFSYGVTSNYVSNHKRLNLKYMTWGICAYLKHRVILDLTYEAPLLDSVISPRPPILLRNWRGAVVLELFSQSDEIFTGIEFTQMVFFDPLNPWEVYLGYATGFYIKLRYIGKVLSVFYRPQIGFLKDFPQKGSNSIFWSSQLGFAFQPIIKGKTYR